MRQEEYSYQTAARLMLQGHDLAEIAARMRITKKQASALLYRARINKTLPPVRRSYRFAARRTRLGQEFLRQMGSAEAMIAGLTEEEFVWLARACPADATVMDVVRSIVSDAYAEEARTTPPPQEARHD